MPMAVGSPSTTAFFNRTSIGSRPSVWAISSITDSTANAAWGADGARYAAVAGVLVNTPTASSFRFGNL